MSLICANFDFTISSRYMLCFFHCEPISFLFIRKKLTKISNISRWIYSICNIASCNISLNMLNLLISEHFFLIFDFLPQIVPRVCAIDQINFKFNLHQSLRKDIRCIFHISLHFLVYRQKWNKYRCCQYLSKHCMQKCKQSGILHQSLCFFVRKYESFIYVINENFERNFCEH